MTTKTAGIPLPIQFDRLYGKPMDKYDTFDSLMEANAYAQSPLSFPGQRIGVKGTGNKREAYIINEDKSLSKLMTQRNDIRIVLKVSDWVGDCPWTQTIAIPFLEPDDNVIVDLDDSVNDTKIVDAIVQSKLAEVQQGENSLTFIAKGCIPTLDIPIKITIGGVVSAVEIPNNVNDNTNHTVVIAKADGWEGSKPPYTQKLRIEGLRPDSNGTVGINPDNSFSKIEKLIAASCGIRKLSQGNNEITIMAQTAKPTKDLHVLVIWGDEIVVFENSDVVEDMNTSMDLILKASEWTQSRPYRQTVRVEGLSEFHVGSVGIHSKATPEEAEAGLVADLALKEQGNGYIVIEAESIKPTIDIPIYIIFGSNISIVPSPDYVGEANKHVDATAYASKWVKSPDGYEQIIDVEGITSNSNGTMGLRQFATTIQIYAASHARIVIAKVYDNKVLLVAKGVLPQVNIPLYFVFGRNINIVKHQALTGKVALTAAYIPFDDSKIQSNLENLQDLLEYFQFNKIGYADIVDNTTSTDKDKPLSANMGKHLEDVKINYSDIVDNTTSTDTNKPLSANMGKHLEDVKINYSDIVDNTTSNRSDKPLSANMGKHLEDVKINYSDIVDNLDTTLTNKPLSANMGNVLDKRITRETEMLNSRITNTEQNLLNQINNVKFEMNEALGDVIIKVQPTQPENIPGKTVLWIKI